MASTVVASHLGPYRGCLFPYVPTPSVITGRMRRTKIFYVASATLTPRDEMFSGDLLTFKTGAAADYARVAVLKSVSDNLSSIAGVFASVAPRLT